MKKFLRIFLATTAAIYLCDRYIGGISYSNDWRVLIMAAVVLTGANLVIKPIVKLITLPINLLTLGFFSSFINALMLYLVTYIVPKFSVNPFDFSGFAYKGIIVPQIHFTNIWAYVLIAAIISWIVSLIRWLTD